MFDGGDAGCYDRASAPHTAVVDTHLHFRPFGGPSLPFAEVVGYLEQTGVLFANVYGIGQMLPVSSACTYYLGLHRHARGADPQERLRECRQRGSPTSRRGCSLTLSMTFPDLARPESVLAGVRLLDEEFPGLFRWMGEVNLVKQALFGNGHETVPLDAIPRWAPFMALLRERGIPMAIHSDLGSDAEPTKYLAWIEEVLRLYPDNKIIWMHLGLSRELTAIDAEQHIRIMRSLVERYPNLMFDLSWRIIDDHVFTVPFMRRQYVDFINAHSERFLPGTDFVASANKDFATYEEELEVTGRIHLELDDTAFRNIALGQNYFRLLGLDHEAPPVCASD